MFIKQVGEICGAVHCLFRKSRSIDAYGYVHFQIYYNSITPRLLNRQQILRGHVKNLKFRLLVLSTQLLIGNLYRRYSEVSIGARL